MKNPRDDKFVITKANPGNPWQWVVWLPVGHRWLSSNGKLFSAHGAGVISFQAARDLVMQRLNMAQRLSDDVAKALASGPW